MQAPEPTVIVAVPPPPPSVAPASEDPQHALRALVCADLEVCSILKEHPAGMDDAGRALSVVLAYGGESSDDEDDPAAKGNEPPKTKVEVEKRVKKSVSYELNGETFHYRSAWPYSKFEYWRITRDGDRIVSADRVLEVCNDGHGAAGMGEDEVTIGDNSLEHQMSGGSSWRWAETRRLSLSPFQLKKTHSAGWWASGSNTTTTDFDWNTFVGRTTWFSPPCNEDGQPATGSDDLQVGADDVAEYVALPSLSLGEAFRTSGWKSTRLGQCAAVIDASGKTGMLLSGPASTAEDATVRIVASGHHELFVEVTDDKIVGPSAQSRADDRLEVWVSSRRLSYMDHCIDPASSVGVVSWSVRVADGQVTSGFGKPSPLALSVERAAGADGAVRFHLRAATSLEHLTIAYVDQDGGKKPARRIATSRLKDGRTATLGTLEHLGDRATCVVKDGGLVPQVYPEK